MHGYRRRCPSPQEQCERYRLEVKRLEVHVRTLGAALELVTAFYAACDTNDGRQVRHGVSDGIGSSDLAKFRPGSGSRRGRPFGTLCRVQ